MNVIPRNVTRRVKKKIRFMLVLFCTASAIVLLNHATLSHGNIISSEKTELYRSIVVEERRKANPVKILENVMVHQTKKTEGHLNPTQANVTRPVTTKLGTSKKTTLKESSKLGMGIIYSTVAHQTKKTEGHLTPTQAKVTRPVTTKLGTSEKTTHKESSKFDMDTIYSKANYSNLDHNHHVSKLISTFHCSIQPLKLLILVTTMVSSFSRRQIIRKTWGKTLHSHVNDDFKTFFAVGYSLDKDIMKKVKDESHLYKDIIFGDFTDIFYNLPYKVEAEFEWAYKHCAFDYYLKVDDDVFVNIPSVLLLIAQKNTPNKNFFVGNKHFSAPVMRHGKYRVTEEEYSTKIFQPFVSGGGFLVSNDVVKKLIPYFKKHPFKLDDVYIGMLAMNAGIALTHNNNFKLYWIGNCEYDKNAFVFHITGVEDRESCMKQLFDSMISTGLGLHVIMEKHYHKMHA